MIAVQLEHLNLYQVLQNRAKRDPVATAFCGLLVIMTGDASELLEFIRESFL